MPALTDSVQAFIDDITGESAWVDELNEHSRRVAEHIETAPVDEKDEALRRFAAILPNAPLVAMGLIAINCGSLVERGGDVSIAGPGLLGRLAEINDAASDFYERCLALAVADAPFVEELRTAMKADADDADKNEDLSPAAIIDSYIAEKDWERLADKFGPVLFQDHPASVLGYMSEEFFRLGVIAHLSRSKPLRLAARLRPELLQSTFRCDERACSHRSFLATILQVLDDESLLVLHVEQSKGFDVRISGIADNFQLHTLLAGAIIGNPAMGWLDGTAPSRRAVAQCQGNSIDRDGGANVTGSFNLLNWTALKPDGSLPQEHDDDATAHWIWNEGFPAEIVPFEGRRVVLLGPPPYVRHCRAGRQFQGMPGELSVERILDATSVHDWLQRLTHAPRQG